MSKQFGIGLRIKERVDLESKQAGKILTTTEIHVPDDCVGIVAIRRSYGNKGIFNTSQILWPGFKGYPELHVANMSGTTVELIEGETIAHVAIVKAQDLN